MENRQLSSSKMSFDHTEAIRTTMGLSTNDDVKTGELYLRSEKDVPDGGRFIADREKKWIEIIPPSRDTEGVKVQTMHISSKSDTYEPSNNYGGIIIYQYDGKSEWRTANNTYCEAAYIVIQDTDSEMVKKWTNEPGIVHGAIYRNAFGESVKKTIIGEGFAIRNDMIEIHSGVFNNPSHSDFHDHRKRMHELSEHCIRKVVEYWRAGPRWPRKTSFAVKELLRDVDWHFTRNDCTYEEMYEKPTRTEI